MAYASVTGGIADIFVHGLIGYSALQALVLLRLLPWIMREPFAPSYWAFTFGVSALATAPLLLLAHTDAAAIVYLAPYLFVAANIVIGLIALGTLRLIIEGRLLLKPAVTTT